MRVSNAPCYRTCLRRLLAKVKCTLCGIDEFMLHDDLRITHWNEICSVSTPTFKNDQITYVLAIILRCSNCASG